MTTRGITLGTRGPTDRTFIPRGTTVHSTAPHWPSEGKPAGRLIDLTKLGFVRFGNDRIVWAGASGYWRWGAARGPRGLSG